MGCASVDTHRGVIMIGNRSTRYRRISNDAEPEPMIMAARNTVTGTEPDARAVSTSRREARCSLSLSPISPKPPR